MINRLKWYLFILLVLPSLCVAALGTSGTYMLQGGGYTFQAEFSKDSLSGSYPFLIFGTFSKGTR